MDLSLQQAADILGKTRRQVVYMITQGRLAAHKVGGRWMVQRSALQVDPDVQERTSNKNERLRAAVEEALVPTKERYYTVRDLKAVQVATSIYRKLLQEGGNRENVAGHIRECLDQLAMGCHRYNRNTKSIAYSAARDSASLAVMELLLNGKAESVDPLVQTIENELMPALAGLIRRVERKGAGS